MKKIVFFHQYKKSMPHSGFTIVELLVVIVVIGILAAITIVSYSGITNKANIAVLQSDLSSASQRLRMYQVTYDSYPTTLSASYCPTAPTADNNLCLKASGNNTYTYTSNGTSFNLIETNPNGTVYNVTDSTAVAEYPWYPGVTATALAGKFVYKTNLGTTYLFKSTNDAVASPQGATGLDPNYSSKMSLVNPQTNPGVDFTAYPAQNACKAIGGRLPNMQELLALLTDRSSYGNNLQNGYYWSATEYSSINSYAVEFYSGAISNYNKTNYFSVRCVSG